MGFIGDVFKVDLRKAVSGWQGNFGLDRNRWLGWRLVASNLGCGELCYGRFMFGGSRFSLGQGFDG